MSNTNCTVKRYHLFSVLTLILVSMFGLSTCIQQEAMNAECDILSAELQEADGTPIQTIQPPRIENNSITFVVAATPAQFILVATLTPGATISKDPNDETLYTVTSEDGDWSKIYKIRIIEPAIPTNFSFETYEIVYRTVLGKQVPSYDVFYESHNSQKLDIWASGNPGYRLSKGTAKPSEYPTSAALGEGFENKGIAAKLVTRSTGFFGNLVGMPIAAGSLYLGTFDVSSATTDPLGATKFGMASNIKPLKLTGYYKYSPGTEFIGGVTFDEPDIYAVLYKPTDAVPFLDGSNILDAPTQIVAVARVEKPTNEWPTTDYAPFTALFDYAYTVDNTDITIEFYQTVADAFGYNITLVFTSSKEGAKFKGALDSTLYIDEVKLTTGVAP